MYLLIVLMTFCATIVAFVFISGPKLGLETQKIIDETLNEELPELIKGKTGFALSNNVRIWYELSSTLYNGKLIANSGRQPS